jgi:hypothetical protein
MSSAASPTRLVVGRTGGFAVMLGARGGLEALERLKNMNLQHAVKINAKHNAAGICQHQLTA